MLMLLACFATFFFTSSRAAMLGWGGPGGGLLVMEGSGGSEAKAPILDRAAVMVAGRESEIERTKDGPVRGVPKKERFY